jgi:hypothetical protein
MINTFKIYEEFISTMGDEAARKLASVLGAIYEDLQNTVTKVEFNELRSTVQELAEAQKRTEQRVDTLALRMEELAEAQKRTEQRVDTLALRMEELAEAQKRTEQSILRLSERLDDTNKQLGGLAMTVGYTLENQAYRALPVLLRRDYGIELEEPLIRDYLIDQKGREVEVNILGRARRGETGLLIVGESKAQLSKRDIDRFLTRRLAQLSGNGRQLFPVLVTHMISAREVAAYARAKDVALYLSYQFG